MKQTLLIICLIVLALPSWGGDISSYCKKEGKPLPEQITGIYFYCGGSIESCSNVKVTNTKNI